MKRVYFVAIFICFLLLVVIGFNLSSNAISGGATLSGFVPQEFSGFGIFAAMILVIASFLLIKKVKKEEY
jgi:cytosine/uracil/thiamine/allantoin permease